MEPYLVTGGVSVLTGWGSCVRLFHFAKFWFATEIKYGWQFPKRLNDWTAAVMKSLAEGKKPSPMPRGKRIPTLEIVVFVKRLQNKGYELGQAKERAKTQFVVGMPAINKALRQIDIAQDVMPDL